MKEVRLGGAPDAAGPPHFVCQVCNHAEQWPTRDDAGCAATWHVYEKHPEVWKEMFGDRPPRDRDPRIEAAKPTDAGEISSTTHDLAARTDESRQAWADRAKSLGEDVHFATHFATMGPESPNAGEVIPWALCDREDQLDPDRGKFVATGTLERLVTCTRCLLIMAGQKILYAVVINASSDGTHTGVLCYVEGGEERRLMELWGHMSSSEGWLKQDLTVNFGRVAKLEEMWPQGYRVVHVGVHDPVPDEISEWFGNPEQQLQKLLADASQEEEGSDDSA